jgi:hypothetical protein
MIRYLKVIRDASAHAGLTLVNTVRGASAA